MKRHKNTYYKVGLGSHFLNRASLIFLILTVLTLGSLGGAIYADYKSGNFRKNVVEPVKNFFSEVGKAFEESSKSPSVVTNITTYTATSSGKINIQINTNSKQTPKSNTIYEIKYQTPVPLPSYSTKSYEDSLKELDQWSQETGQKYQEDYERRVQDAQKQQDDWWAQKTKEFEDFKKQHGL